MDIFNLPIISIALSIIISWALFAIFVGLIQEAIAQILAERGRFMKAYLLQQLRDDPNGINWASLIYLHGPVDLLSRAPNKPTNDINPRLFAESFIEVVGQLQIVQMNKKPNAYQNLLLSNFKSATQTLDHSDVLAFLKMSLNSAETRATNLNSHQYESEVYEHLVLQIENWYKEFQERLTLWYKKKVRRRVFFLGLILSIIINVDSIQLFKFYSLHPQAREAVADYYHQYVDTSSGKNSDVKSNNATGDTTPVQRMIIFQRQDSAGRTIFDSVEVNDTSQQIATLALIPVDSAKRFYASADSLIQANGLPVGFRYSLFKPHQNTFDWWLWKLLGLLITGFAASFGAPFWFDVLKKAYTKKI